MDGGHVMEFHLTKSVTIVVEYRVIGAGSNIFGGTRLI